jgi:hypothetical protein
MARSRAADKYFCEAHGGLASSCSALRFASNAGRPRLTNFGFTPDFPISLKAEGQGWRFRPLLLLPLHTSARTRSGLPSLKFLPIAALIVGILHSQHIFTAPITLCLAVYRLFSQRPPLSTLLADQCPVTGSTLLRYGSAADIWYLCGHLRVTESGEPASRPRSTLASELSSPGVAPSCSLAAVADLPDHRYRWKLCGRKARF